MLFFEKEIYFLYLLLNQIGSDCRQQAEILWNCLSSILNEMLLLLSTEHAPCAVTQTVLKDERISRIGLLLIVHEYYKPRRTI